MFIEYPQWGRKLEIQTERKGRNSCWRKTESWKTLEIKLIEYKKNLWVVEISHEHERITIS